MKLAVKHEQGHSQQRQSQCRESPRRQQTPFLVKGSVVEVSSNEEGLKGVWYEAKILNSTSLSKKRSPHSGKVYVEYKSLLSDKDTSKPLREYISAEFVRPAPPVESRPFKIGDNVDAHYSDGWWPGVITDIVEGFRFKVTFQNPPDVGDFDASVLRFHREWVNDSWIPPANQEVSIPSDYKILDGFADKNGNSVGVTTTPLNISTPTKSTYDEKTPFSSRSKLNKIKFVTPSNDESLVIDSSPREMAVDSPYNKETLIGEVVHYAAAPSTETNASYNTSEILNNVASAEKDAQPLGGDQWNGNHSLHKNVKRKRTAVVRSRKTPENKVQVKTPQNTIGGKEGNEAADGVTEDVPRDSPVIKTILPVVLGLACVNSISSASKQSSRSNGEEAAKCNGEEAAKCIKVTNQFQVSPGSQKKGRGRPRKSVEPLSITPMLDVEAATNLETSSPGQLLGGTEGSSKMLVDDQSKQENRSGIKNLISPLISGGENAVETLVKHRYVRQPAKRGKKRLINLNLSSDVHDVAYPNSGEEKIVEASCMTEDSERVVVGSPNDTNENQPLSKWFGDLNSPPVDSSRSDMDIIKEAIPATVKELEKLPFEKKSPVWSVLESMEVFNKLPQKPHFKALENFKENVREGLAIGLMVTFTGAVERTSNMKHNDPKASIDDILETLLELETHGFDVGVVRERINNFERKIERREKLEDEVKKLKKEVEEKELEKSRIDEEMEVMNKQMKELQEKLSRRMLTKEIKKGEIDSLQLMLMSVKEDMKKIGREFEGNKGSLWL